MDWWRKIKRIRKKIVPSSQRKIPTGSRIKKIRKQIIHKKTNSGSNQKEKQKVDRSKKIYKTY